MASGPARAASRAFTAPDLDRLQSGGNVVAMAVSGVRASWARGMVAELGKRLLVPKPDGGFTQRYQRQDIGSLTGTATARYPDHMPKKNVLWELKNVRYLRLTSQMADFLFYAHMNGIKVELYIRPNLNGVPQTKIAASMQEAIDILKADGLIEIKYFKKGKY